MAQMNAQRRWHVLVGLAGILECGMALAHFGLHWEWLQIRDFGSLPLQLRWALFALNFSWSVLLLCVGGLVLHAASDGADTSSRRLVFVLGAFWVIHGVYVAAIPMPVPAYLSWLRVPLVAFPATLVALHFGALLATPVSRPTVALR